MATRKIEIKAPHTVRYWKQPHWVMKTGEAKNEAEGWMCGVCYLLLRGSSLRLYTPSDTVHRNREASELAHLTAFKSVSIML